MTSIAAPETAPRRGWTIALWVAQIALAFAFASAGWLKTFTPIADLAPMLPWALEQPEALVRFIGIAELLGAAGLILPALTRILPGLTPLAASGLALVQVLAMGFHIGRLEFAALPFNLVLLLIGAFIAWGRWRKAPIAPR